LAKIGKKVNKIGKLSSYFYELMNVNYNFQREIMIFVVHWTKHQKTQRLKIKKAESVINPAFKFLSFVLLSHQLFTE